MLLELAFEEVIERLLAQRYSPAEIVAALERARDRYFSKDLALRTHGSRTIEEMRKS